jgi:dTDP-4-amino-4,6-dideoxy-D-galactose acyltransferase
MTDHVIEALDWDSSHYGMSVGRIASSVETPDGLQAALVSGATRGIRLLYWLSSDAFIPDQRMLSRFGGRRIVGGRRYRRPLVARDTEQPADARCVSLAGATPDRVLRDLALVAGSCSRFRLDTRLPLGRFEAMYERWIERSLLRELADDVLVLRDDAGQTSGLITYEVRDAIAKIGLVATSQAARGKGLGSTMLAQTHRRIGGTGAECVDVWTQSENEAACRFYEASGYVMAYQGSYYHFLTS